MRRIPFWFLGFTASFAIAMAYVFWGTWSPEIAFIQPDQGVIYPADFLMRRWRDFCGGGSLVPGDLRFLLGGPYVWQELQYALAMYLAALGVVYYLKGRGLPPLACYGAGAAYGFMGYNFTLFSAGHLGWFVFLMYGPFCFGLIDRCVRKGKWVNWILLGGVLAWGSAQQPDMWLLFTLLAFVYGLFKTVRALMSAEAGSRMRRLGMIAAGVAVTAAVLVAVGWPQLSNAIFVQTANRDKQIAGTTGVSARSDGQKSVEEIRAEREKRYVFCTNWSLPPNEVLEFAVPDVNGGSSDPRVSPRNAYRGRIGMQYAPGRWSPYRQHSLYMGFFTLCLALAGLAFGLCKAKPGVAAAECGLRNRPEVIFWAVAASVLLLVAFGCFTPFYRLVFMLPMGDYIRCPVKFVHLIEWCVAVLAGFGVAGVLESGLARKAPRCAFAALSAIVLVNLANLAVVDSGYCAVDPSDTVRIAVARETGSNSIGFAMDANAKIGGDEYLVGGGMAFKDNAALKDALAKGEYAVVSFWTLQGGRMVKTSRERAAFALLKKSQPSPQPQDGPAKPGAVPMISLVASFAVCALALVKSAGRI